jgi:hypothetical protein
MQCRVFIHRDIVNPAPGVKASSTHLMTAEVTTEANKEARKEATSEAKVESGKKTKNEGNKIRELEAELEEAGQPPRLFHRLDNLADIHSASPTTSKAIEVKKVN